MAEQFQTVEIATLIVAGIAAVAVVVTAIAACLSAQSASRAARETRDATQARIMSSLLDDWASPHTLDAMLTLDAWRTRHGDQHAEQFRRLRINDYEQVRSVDQARRWISHYFQKIEAMREANVLDERALRSVATRKQVAFYVTVLEPLEAAVRADYDRSSFESLAALYSILRQTSTFANPRHGN